VIIGGTQSIALAGLRAASARQAQSAYNIAHVNTPGYQPPGEASSAVRVSEGGSAANAAMLTRLSGFARGADLAAASGTDLAAETVEQISSLHAFKASLAALRTADEMTESLLNIKA
jgi:flagellar hook protein FlgE